MGRSRLPRAPSSFQSNAQRPTAPPPPANFSRPPPAIAAAWTRTFLLSALVVLVPLAALTILRTTSPPGGAGFVAYRDGTAGASGGNGTLPPSRIPSSNPTLPADNETSVENATAAGASSGNGTLPPGRAPPSNSTPLADDETSAENATVARNESSPLDPPPLPPNATNATRLWVDRGVRRFEIPTDVDWIQRYPGVTAGNVAYLTDHARIRARGGQGNCSGTLEVLGWITDRVNGRGGCLMVAYGQLIHVHREGDLVDGGGRLLDDDVDLWAPPATVARIVALERQLFENFGWTTRLFSSGGQVVLVQVVASCGHMIATAPGKAQSSRPPIEIYPVARMKAGGDDVVRDLWQRSLFPASMVFPARNMTLASAGAARPLELLVPNRPEKILECIYGNWRRRSPAHAKAFTSCA